MQSGLLWFASGMWASQQSGEQKCSGRRLRLQVDTEQRYHSAPNAMGFLHTLQRLHAAWTPIIVAGSPGGRPPRGLRGDRAGAYVAPPTGASAGPAWPRGGLRERFDVRARTLS